ncbi:fork head domain-containing protein [Jimgerdemannia flammicorona]|uniref:Fork head domain-containing protein n=1 Tax=Jimgerdemannia flammicorona TaxID=994334 RepID=A0A433DI04_9FUNG|nr:fork head domain-containing protein [Jimgerdemannia flammicorona]
MDCFQLHTNPIPPTKNRSPMENSLLKFPLASKPPPKKKPAKKKSSSFQENILISTPNSTRERLAAAAAVAAAASLKKASTKHNAERGDGNGEPPSSQTVNKATAPRKTPSSPLARVTAISHTTPPKLPSNTANVSQPTPTRPSRSKTSSSTTTKDSSTLPSPHSQLASSLLLAALPWKPKDPRDKPPYSYATLIAQAILSSAERKLTLNEIYLWISERYKFYKVGDHGWQNSIRHNLSLNKAFVKLERQPVPGSNIGKGSHWTVKPGSEIQFLENLQRRGNFSTSNDSTESSSVAALVLAFNEKKTRTANPRKRKQPSAHHSKKSSIGGRRDVLPDLAKDSQEKKAKQGHHHDNDDDDDEETCDDVASPPPHKRVMTELSLSDPKTRINSPVTSAHPGLPNLGGVMHWAIEAHNQRKRELAKAQRGQDELQSDEESSDDEPEEDIWLDKENVAPQGLLLAFQMAKEVVSTTGEANTKNAISMNLEQPPTPIGSGFRQVQELVQMRQEQHEESVLMTGGYYSDNEEQDVLGDEVLEGYDMKVGYRDGVDSLILGSDDNKQSPWREVLKSDLFEEEEEKEEEEEEEEELPPSSPVEVTSSSQFQLSDLISEDIVLRRQEGFGSRQREKTNLRDVESTWERDGSEDENEGEDVNDDLAGTKLVSLPINSGPDLNSGDVTTTPRQPRYFLIKKPSTTTTTTTATSSQTFKTTSTSSSRRREILSSPPSISRHPPPHDPFISSATGLHHPSPNASLLSSSPLRHCAPPSASPTGLRFGFEDDAESFDHLCSYDYLQQTRSGLESGLEPGLAWGAEFSGLEFAPGQIEGGCDQG